MFRIFSALLDVLCPPFCVVCERQIKKPPICFRCAPRALETLGPYTCTRCYLPLVSFNQSTCATCKLFPLPFEQVRYIWSYNDRKAHDLINIMKYRPARSLCHWSGQQLARSLNQLFLEPQWDLIVPIPSSRRSLNERLFNQCVEISKQFKRTSKIPAKISAAALYHRGRNLPQASLPHAVRLKNVSNCFHATEHLVRNKSILLVDDVITTGATSVTAGIELLNKGAAKVDLLALARADNWQEHRNMVHQAPVYMSRLLS